MRNLAEKRHKNNYSSCVRENTFKSSLLLTVSSWFVNVADLMKWKFLRYSACLYEIKKNNLSRVYYFFKKV
jgi:hypothetical protein